MPNFGEWCVANSLGEGGQGWTYLAYRSDDPSKAKFVLKRLKDPGRRERFQREVAALRKLSHPGVVKIVDYNLEQERPYLVMEFCGGGDLSKLDLNALRGDQKLELFRQICAAVAEAHNAGIIHRDLKPKNILFRAELKPVVADFGLAMDLNALLDRPTETGEAVGPGDYTAPELEGGPIEDPQPSSDVYSLGKLLYFLLSGRNLPRERHRAPQFNLISDTAPPYVHFAYELLDRSISEDPSNRYKNASGLLNALEGVMERVAHSAHILDLRVRQPCLCVEGAYQLRLVHEPGARSPAPPPLSKYEFWRDSTTFEHTPWTILVCDTCGNVQMFRPDLGANPPRWKNVPKVEH